MDDEDTQESFEVESEWQQVNRLLSQKSEAGWTLAMIEAHKIFCQVLSEVSFGETIDEQIHNAGELFKDMGGILAAHDTYQRIVSEVGYRPTRKDAQKGSEALFQAVLDMVGRDFEAKGFWHRLANSLNFFWGHHPRSLAGLLAGLLLFVISVWFLADTMPGRWVVDLTVGFSRFILSRTVLVVLLLVALLIAIILSLTYLGRRRRE